MFEILQVLGTNTTAVVTPPDFIDRIIELSNTMLIVGIPAVIGVITAVASIIKTFSNSKKVDDAMDIGINGGKTAITFGQKVTENINEFVPFVKAIYELLPEEKKRELEQRGLTVEYLDKRAKTSLAQINKLKGALSKKVDPDLDDTLPREDNLAVRYLWAKLHLPSKESIKDNINNCPLTNNRTAIYFTFEITAFIISSAILPHLFGYFVGSETREHNFSFKLFITQLIDALHNF